MLHANKLLLGFLLLFLGANMIAQAPGPSISVTFKADPSVDENLSIIFANQTKTLPKFGTPTGSSVIFSTGLNKTSQHFLDAKGPNGLSSKSYTFAFSTRLVVTITVFITRADKSGNAIPLNQQITFSADSGQLLPRTAGVL